MWPREVTKILVPAYTHIFAKKHFRDTVSQLEVIRSGRKQEAWCQSKPEEILEGGGIQQNVQVSVLKSGNKANFPQKEVVHCCYTGYSLQDETSFDTNIKTTSQKMISAGNGSFAVRVSEDGTKNS